jgi:FtsP/CotA-like multicopper oxidase with cupredoxin domain
VLARRIAIVASTMFLLIVVAGSLAAREAQESRAIAPTTAEAAEPPAPVVRGELPADQVIRARVGDVVSIAVRTPVPDDASIPQLGINAPTSPDVAGVLEFVATAPGRYPVVLVATEQPAGVVVVER